MITKSKHRLSIAKITFCVLLIYLGINWVWIYMSTLSHAQRISEHQHPESGDPDEAETDDIDDDPTQQLLDPELESAVRLIEHGPVVNHHHYPLTINNDQLCADSVQTGLAPGDPVKRRRVFLLVYVHSAPEHYVQRLLLRQTWARPGLYDLSIRIAFFMGRRRSDPVLDQAVRLEAGQFRDIIQAEFEDSYRNLTLKAMTALGWISRYCNRTRFILKTDDDAYVNMRALLKHLDDIRRQHSVSPVRRLVLCRIWTGMQVLRSDPKWAVSRTDFAADVYPPYCSGIALVMSLDVVIAMSRIKSRVVFFWVDDVYLTGLLTARLSKSGASVRWAEFGHAYIRMDKMEAFDSPLWYRYVFVHLAEMNYFAQMWPRMEAAAQRYPIPEVSKVVPGHIAGHNWTDT